MLTALWVILGVLAIFTGLLGTIYPAIPGLFLMFGGAWLLAYASDYQIIGKGALSTLFILSVLGTITDFVAGLLGAKFTGATKEALWGAFIGGIVGAFFSIPGLLLGPFIGAAIGEFWAKRDMWVAGKVGIGTFIGFIVGTAAKIGCAVVSLLVLIGVGAMSLF